MGSDLVKNSAQSLSWAMGKADRESAKKILEGVKKLNEGKRGHRVDKNTIILLDASLTDDQVEERKKRFLKHIEEDRKIYR